MSASKYLREDLFVDCSGGQLGNQASGVRECELADVWVGVEGEIKVGVEESAGESVGVEVGGEVRSCDEDLDGRGARDRGLGERGHLEDCGQVAIVKDRPSETFESGIEGDIPSGHSLDRGSRGYLFVALFDHS